MEILKQGDDKKITFYMEENGKRIAEIHSIFAGGDKIIIEHTEVNEDYEGKGLGKMLVLAVIDYVKENNIKVIPLCPYANGFFKKNYETYKDILWSLY